MEIPTLKYDPTQPFTVEAVVDPHPKQPGAVTLLGNFWHDKGIALAFPGGNWTFEAHFQDGNDRALRAISDERPSPGQSVHLAGVYDTKHVRLYVDGKLQQRSIVATSPHLPAPPPMIIGADGGSADRPMTAEDFFRGTIDEVRFSNTARYTEDFTPARRFESDEHTIALYHFDEGGGTAVYDASGNGHHGTIHGNAKWVRVDEDE